MYLINSNLVSFRVSQIHIECFDYTESDFDAVSYTHLDVYKRQGAPWVVMERLPGVHRDQCPLPSAEKHRRTAEMVAQIHNVSGTGYGYVQNGLYENLSLIHI